MNKQRLVEILEQLCIKVSEKYREGGDYYPFLDKPAIDVAFTKLLAEMRKVDNE